MATNYNLNYPTDSTATHPQNATFGTEIVIQREWTGIWLRKMPLLAMIKDGRANWNKGTGINGTRMIIPINMADLATPADGRTDANELTAITPFATDGFSQASYEITHYVGATYIKASERRLINNARGNFEEGKMRQLMDSFANAMADDMLKLTTIEARDKFLSLEYVTATGNSPGGISQTTYTDWAAQVTTGAGTFVLDLIDDLADRVDARGGSSKLGLFESNTTNNVWGKLKASIGAAERITNNDFKKKYGVKNVVYADITCVMENRLQTNSPSATDGRFLLLDTDHWYYRGEETPTLLPKERLQGTDADEYFANLFGAIGCGNASVQASCQGINA